MHDAPLAPFAARAGRIPPRWIYPVLGASAEDESNKQGDGGTPTGAVSQENLSRLLAREAQVRVDGTWVKPIPDDRYIYVPPQRQKGANVQ